MAPGAGHGRTPDAMAPAGADPADGRGLVDARLRGLDPDLSPAGLARRAVLPDRTGCAGCRSRDPVRPLSGSRPGRRMRIGSRARSLASGLATGACPRDRVECSSVGTRTTAMSLGLDRTRRPVVAIVGTLRHRLRLPASGVDAAGWSRRWLVRCARGPGWSVSSSRPPASNPMPRPALPPASRSGCIGRPVQVLRAGADKTVGSTFSSVSSLGAPSRALHRVGALRPHPTFFADPSDADSCGPREDRPVSHRFSVHRARRRWATCARYTRHHQVNRAPDSSRGPRNRYGRRSKNRRSRLHMTARSIEGQHRPCSF